MAVASSFIEPPTAATLADARRSLEAIRVSISDTTAKINAAEATLAQIVRDSQFAITELQNERVALEDKALQTLAYLSPIKRLPPELLRSVFLFCFEEYPCSAWVLSAVCTSWRRLVLRVPILWSRIRLVATPNTSPDTIRLWLERSGNTVPLDVEISLRVANTKPSLSSSKPKPARRSTPSLSPPPSPWGVSFPHSGLPYSYVIPPPPPLTPPSFVVVPPNLPVSLPPSPTADTWPSSGRVGDRPHPHALTRSSLHWGYVAIYYLVEQMHRWERFVFRFDEHFASMSALKSIYGHAPLLKEFQVSGIEAGFYPDWQWLPNAPATAKLELPQLRTVTLQHAPFKWFSPMLRPNLRTLNLRALPTAHLSLDRILYIVANNPHLESLSLHFHGVLPAILPLTPATLPHLTKLSIGGHYSLTELIESLVLPTLDDLMIDIEMRNPIEETISNLLTRSGQPPLRHLSVAYGNPNTPGSGPSSSALYYATGGVVISWMTLLTGMNHLKSLRFGGTPLEALLAALGPPDDDDNPLGVWACPNLEELGARNCHTHSEGVVKLVQMVQGRNPVVLAGPSSSSTSGSSSMSSGGFAFAGTGAGTTTPVPLKSLELYDCTTLGQDVVDWMKRRIEYVVCTDPAFEH